MALPSAAPPRVLRRRTGLRRRTDRAQLARRRAREFRARVGDKELKGVDLIRFDAGGRITDFEVMIRPASALQALAEEMGRRLAAAMPGPG